MWSLNRFAITVNVMQNTPSIHTELNGFQWMEKNWQRKRCMYGKKSKKKDQSTNEFVKQFYQSENMQRPHTAPTIEYGFIDGE